MRRCVPLGGALVWTYDALGNRLRQRNRTDPLLTASVAWTYDGAGRILTRTADGVTTTYTYDATGNKLTATTGGQAITTTYDRLNRPLTIDDEDADTTADTTYTYSLTSPAWSDPSGSYTATLDRFDRPTALNDPVNATDFTWTYRADGQAGSFAQPNGNTTALAYDPVGRLTSKDTGSLVAIGGQLLIACTPTPSPSETALLREEVVSLVTSGELGPQGVVDDKIGLPENLAEASEGGSIAMTRNPDGLTLVFFLRRGVVDDWSGYVYRSEGGVTEDPLGGGGPIVVRDLGEGWFYVEAS